VRLIGRGKLASLSERDQQTAKWVAAWISELRIASWKRPADIRGQFPKASRQTDGTFLFPVLQKNVGICVLIDFSQGVALVVAIRILETSNGY
jgi:mRNA-degrading endonuclease HigB of HigAB toxin-antitoxin module